MKKEQIISGILLIGIVAGNTLSRIFSHAETPILENTIEVSVDGEVAHPGVYEMDAGSSVQDLLELSGVNETADLSQINPLWTLKDKDKLQIPQKRAEDQKISINTGTKEELMQLSGIGEKTAQAIIDYRNANGLFQRIEDLKNVKGIGEKKLEKIRDKISL